LAQLHRQRKEWNAFRLFHGMPLWQLVHWADVGLPSRSAERSTNMFGLCKYIVKIWNKMAMMKPMAQDVRPMS
jgi:hypothetical protein